MSPVEFANQDRGYWYKLRGRACETRIDPGAQQSGVRGQQAPNLIEICGDWGEFSDAVELSPLGVCRPLSSGVRGSGGSVQRTACVPPKPTNLTVAGVSDSEATLKWQASEGATDYAVRLDGVVVDDSIGDVTEYRFIGLAARTAHVLSVDAKNSVGSSASAELTLLVPPHGLSATTTRNSISLSWTLDGRATKAEARLGATGNVEDADARTSHTFDQSIRPSSSYTVYVRAANAQGSSAWASMSVATQGGCASQQPAKPESSRDQLVETETRWSDPVGGQTAEEQRERHQPQTRSVTWSSSGCRWVTGDWTDAGGAVWKRWTPTGVTRVAPAKPANSQTIVVRSETRWAEPVGGRTAEEQRNSVQRQSRSVTWDETACAWSTGAWGDPGSPSWTPWKPTGVTRAAPAKPVDSQNIVVRSNTRWAEPVGGRTAEEQRDSVQRQSRSVTWDETACAWSTGAWGDPGSPSWTPWKPTGVTRAAPAKPADSQNIVARSETRWAEPVGGRTAEELRDSVQRQSRSVSWDTTAGAWSTGTWGNVGPPSWTLWSATGVTRAAPAKPANSQTIVVRSETRWAEPVGGRTAEEQRDLVQRQSRSVSWDTADCAWITGSWGNVGSPAWTPWRPTGVTRVAPAKPSGNQSIVVRSETRWAEPVGGNTAEEQRDLVQRQSRRVSWDAADCAWITGSWGNVGSPAWTPWSSTGRIRTAPAKPAGTLVEEVSPRRTQLDWQLRGMTAHEVIRVRMQRRSRSVTWDETLCAWQTGQYGRATYFWSGWSDTGNTKPKPSDDVVRVTVQTTTQTRWVRIDDGVFCLLEEQSRTGVRYSYHRRPHVWSDSAHAWLDGRRNPRPYFTEPPGAFHWSSWTRTGRSQRCLQSPADGTASGQSGSAATAPAARLQAGSYHFVWGAHAFTFAVPEGATVILSARTLGSGIEAAVFSSSNGAELVVDPGSLPAHSASSGPTVTGVTDATLLAIAASIRQAAPQVAAQQAEAEQACAVAEGGSFRLDLDADPCIAVWGGGTATVSRSGSSLTLVLASSRSWLVVAATHGASEIPAVMLVDIASGGYLTIKAADGTELSRNLGTGGEVLGALFDAMLPQPGDDTS